MTQISRRGNGPRGARAPVTEFLAKRGLGFPKDHAGCHAEESLGFADAMDEREEKEEIKREGEERGEMGSSLSTHMGATRAPAR